MKRLFIICTLAWVVAACSGEIDCRHKTKECAEGFTCEERSGAWVCQKAEASKTDEEVPEPQDVEQPKQAEPAPQKKLEPAPCPQHRQCGPKAVECICAPNGRLMSRTLDKDGDGKPDEKAAYRHDEHGRPLAVVIDEGMDGTEDKRHSYTYDDRGNPLTWDVVGLPGGNAPDDKSRLSYRYDQEGNLVAEELDLGIDEKVDKRCKYDPPCPAPIPNPTCKRVCE